MIKDIYGILIAVENLEGAVANLERFLEVKPEYVSGYEGHAVRDCLALVRV
jgi:hypothetical protein